MATRTRTQRDPGVELPPIARQVDQALCRIDDNLDWLQALSPRDSHGLWEAFRASGYRAVPEFRYHDLEMDPPALRQDLLALPVEDVEHQEVKALLWEKQRELDSQIELVELRGTSGFLPASIDLWGDAEMDLVECAQELLAALPVGGISGQRASCQDVCLEAERQIEEYRRRDPAFASRVHIVKDLSAKLMVSKGDLHVAADIDVPADQVPPLIQHEIGTHALTRHNGSFQHLEQLKCGLAHYHSLQEGLGVLSEYLSGHLDPSRVRILCARVVATRMVCHGHSVEDIFEHLTETHAMPPHEAFNVALRAGRGGGMTKDAAYLRGLRELLLHLKAGEPLEFLFVGKLALAQVPILRDLEQDGLLVPPRLLPLYMDTAEGQDRLDDCRRRSLPELIAGSAAA